MYELPATFSNDNGFQAPIAELAGRGPVPYMRRMVSQPSFSIGQIVHHKKFGYRGVVFDVDLSFSLSDQWYERVAQSRPPRDAPWYRVLVHGSVHETYVAERHLEADRSGEPIEHVALEDHFDEFRGDHYARVRNLN